MPLRSGVTDRQVAFAASLVGTLIVVGSILLVRGGMSPVLPVADSRGVLARYVNDRLPPGATLYLPLELQMDTRGLRKDLEVKLIRHAKRRQALPREEIIAQLPNGEGAFLVVPAWGYDKRLRGKSNAEKLRHLYEEIEVAPILTTGTRDILLNYFQFLPNGNPRITLGRLVRRPVSLPRQ
jgi:hypothetical protein